MVARETRSNPSSHLSAGDFKVVFDNFHGVGRHDITVGFIVFSRFMEIQCLAAEGGSVNTVGYHFRFRSFFRFGFLLLLLFFDLTGRAETGYLNGASQQG